ncbi:MAG: bifunctional UDP-N-acetylglucosamine diphosphorylase/glucosamine-1-phosphate N-acetyltransferase GlmU [Deltaproteobacteria bacterium]|nr:bifunctional UDP-N-acetylglucosamine diphosphorylase/glucosamine-1-phosphate N-acetyltransferase GlmU [Deltaproteobacteria bacterium]
MPITKRKLVARLDTAEPLKLRHRVMQNKLAAIILAAGVGKRMRSRLPKVLHSCCGLPLISHAVRLALARKCNPIVVVISPQGEKVKETLIKLFPQTNLKFAVQSKPYGTGDATAVGLEALKNYTGNIFITYGDVPLLTSATVARLERAVKKASLALLTAELADPKGYGRVVRSGTLAQRIVEDKDANVSEQAICEINAGAYVVNAALLRKALKGLSPSNAQGELYLTDIIPIAAAAGGAVPVKIADFAEACGVNNRAELASAEAVLQQRLIALHQKNGVTFRNPQNTVIGFDVTLAADVEIGVGVQLYGKIKIGRGSRINGPTIIRDTFIAENVQIESFCHIENAHIAAGARIGPFARLRPGADVGADAHVGNFVEIKKASLGKGAKANHFTYLGDTTVGPKVNIGAGTITCNYDGKNKHPTSIGKGAFIGSNSTLVAPLEIGDGAYIAAGSTITQKVPADTLAFGRARQQNREGYANTLRKRIANQKGKK